MEGNGPAREEDEVATQILIEEESEAEEAAEEPLCQPYHNEKLVSERPIDRSEDQIERTLLDSGKGTEGDEEILSDSSPKHRHQLEESVLVASTSTPTSGDPSHTKLERKLKHGSLAQANESPIEDSPIGETSTAETHEASLLSPVYDASVASPVSSSSSDLSSPLPVARGGPVVIPRIPPHLLQLRESLSPLKDLSPHQPQYAPYNPSPELAHDRSISLTAMISPPPRPSATSMQTPTYASTLATVPPIRAGPSTVTPATHLSSVDSYGVSVTQNKILKSTPASLMVSASVDRPSAAPGSSKADRKTEARTLAIRGRLDAAFRDKPTTLLGPPQRTVSSASSNSASSRSSHAAGPARPPSRTGQVAGPSRVAPRASTAVTRPGHGTNTASASHAPAQPGTVRPRPSIAPGFAQPTLASSRAASSKPVAQTTNTKSTLIKSTTRPVSRPPLVPRSIPQPSARPPSASAYARPTRPAITKPVVSYSAPAHRSVSPEPFVEHVKTANPLKRSLSTVQPTLAKSLVASSGAPPRLGLPARMIRQGGPSAGPVFSVGFAESTGGSSLGSVRPAYRSPGKYGKRTYGSPLLQERRVS